MLRRPWESTADEMIGHAVWTASMIHRRTKFSIAIVIVVLLLLAGAIYLRKEAPPEAARLLPESDGIVYLNLRPLRAATHFDQHPVAHSPEYQHFIDATGINPERDLDEAAFALHRMGNPNGPNGLVAFSEVFIGHFDGRRLSQYLGNISRSQESYAGHTIWDIPSEGRIVRVTILGYDIIAVSNSPSQEQIHSMIDRYRTAALPFSGSSLLAKHYSQVPLLSIAWGVGQIALPLGDSGGVRVMGMRLPLPVDATMIASVRWVGRIHLRIEEIAPTVAAAADSTESMQSILVLLKSVSSTASGQPFDPDMKTMINSITVERHDNRALLTAIIPTSLLQRLMSTPSELRDLAAPKAVEPPNPAGKK